MTDRNATLVLTVSWMRGDKMLSCWGQTWWPVGVGRFVCGFCGETMTGKALRGHFFGCAAREGMLPDD